MGEVTVSPVRCHDRPLSGGVRPVKDASMIRAYEAEDAARVAALIDESTPPLYAWKLHQLHGPDRDEGGWKRTRVAVGPLYSPTDPLAEWSAAQGKPLL